MATIKYKDPATGEISKIPFVVGNSTPESFYGVLPLVKGGTYASTASGARANLGVAQMPKLLWSGSWSSGSITVDEFSSYTLLLAQTTDGDSAICWKDGNLLLGGELYPLSGSSGQMSYALRASFNADTLTMQNSYAIIHGVSGQHSDKYSRTVNAIYGLLLNNDILQKEKHVCV